MSAAVQRPARWRRAVIALLPLLVVAVPVALRPTLPPPAEKAVQVTVVSPHSEMTRGEFGRRFQVWARRELHVEVDFDWRSLGGTGDIVRYLDSQYVLGFAEAFPAHRVHAGSIASTALDRPEDPSKPDAGRPARLAARAAFLASDVGIGIDLFWGGGEIPHRQQAEKGYLVDAGLLTAEPTWFGEGRAIPPTLSGETMYDAKGRYYGACLSSFGICANVDRLSALGLLAPRQWDDLADPRLLGATIIADPTRSGAVLACLERIVQQAMARAVQRGVAEPAALAAGWSDGVNLIKRITANAGFVSDGASLAVRAVAHGDVAVGMAIDFHGRAESEWSRASDGGERLSYLTPVGGSSYSADPIALLRGAGRRARSEPPETAALRRQVAVAFMRFVLSPEGQRVWNHRVGTSHGPVRYNLRRLPIRRDVYSTDDRAMMSDPGVDPFAEAAAFTYRPKWTGPYYRLLGALVKAVALDPQDELTAAWRAIIAAGGPARVPKAAAAFAWLPVDYASAGEAAKTLGDDAQRLATLRGWTVTAQERYRLAARLAREGR